MNRKLFTMICLLFTLSFANCQVNKKELKEYFNNVPFYESFDVIQEYCLCNGFTSSKNIYDSSLIDYKIEYSKPQSFTVDITDHSINVSWAFCTYIEDRIINSALIFSRLYSFSKDSSYSQDKCDLYIKDLYNTYKNDFSKVHQHSYSSDIYDGELNVIGEHTIYNLGKYKGSRYYYEILLNNMSITQNLIREM